MALPFAKLSAFCETHIAIMAVIACSVAYGICAHMRRLTHSRLGCQVPGEAESKAQQPVASFSAVPAAPPDEQRLTWRALRSVGAGFWLTDPQLLRCARAGWQLLSCSNVTCQLSHAPAHPHDAHIPHAKGSCTQDSKMF